ILTSPSRMKSARAISPPCVKQTAAIMSRCWRLLGHRLITSGVFMALDFSYNFNTHQLSFSWTRSALSWLGFSFVAFGLAMLSAPWWQPILISILVKANLVVNEENSWQVPTLSIVFGLGCIACKYF